MKLFKNYGLESLGSHGNINLFPHFLSMSYSKILQIGNLKHYGQYDQFDVLFFYKNLDVLVLLPLQVFFVLIYKKGFNSGAC